MPNHLAELIQFDTENFSVTTREGKHREFKCDFAASDFSGYTKTLAAFSNADGGILIFGVSEKPRLIVGTTQVVDESQWANRLREDFDPEIVVTTKVYTVGALQLFAVGVDPCPNRPVICRKTRSRSITDKNGKIKDVEVLREGSIYFRYSGQTRAIGYCELASMLADRERKRIQSVMETLKVMERVGFENTGMVNIKDEISNLYVSRETAKGLTLIDHGKFIEKGGARLPMSCLVQSISIRLFMRPSKKKIRTCLPKQPISLSHLSNNSMARAQPYGHHRYRHC